MKKNLALSRRLVLKGFGGAAIALPLLEVQHEALAQTVSGPKRFMVFFEHGGTLCASRKNGTRYDGTGTNQGKDAWDPAVKTEQLVVGPIHQPLVGFTDQLIVARGIDNMACKQQSPYGGDHGWANASTLTSAVVKSVNDDSQVAQGPSIDFVLANRLAQRQPVPFPIVSLAVPAHNYGTPFYQAAGQAVEGDFNPTTVFNRLFAGVSTTSQPDPAAARARALKKSVLDGVHKNLDLYKTKLSAADKVAIDAHLSSIRTLEQEVAATAVPMVAGCSKPDITGAGTTATTGYYNIDISKTGPVMVDILVHAFRCGLTNVGTLNLGDFFQTWLKPTYPAAYDIGHSLHHAARDVGATGSDASRFQAWYDTMLINRQWRMGLLARLMTGLKNSPEGTGNMLDNSLILATSEFSTGADHSCADLPILLAGKAGGKLRTGRFVNYNTRAATNPNTLDYSTKASIHNLYTSILNIFGGTDTHFGSTGHAYVEGPLAGLS